MNTFFLKPANYNSSVYISGTTLRTFAIYEFKLVAGIIAIKATGAFLFIVAQGNYNYYSQKHDPDDDKK